MLLEFAGVAARGYTNRLCLSEGVAMREMTIRIRFKVPSLGDAKRNDSRFYMLRDPDNRVMFMRSWFTANMVLAAGLFGRHQDEVNKIFWDVVIDGVIEKNGWYRRFYRVNGGKERYALHEAFLAGQIIGINCVVPDRISDDEFWSMMAIAGRYKGLSPWKPGQFGLYEVESLRPRRIPPSGGDKEVQTDSSAVDIKV